MKTKISTAYNISLMDSDFDTIKTIKFDTFDKEKIEKTFLEFAKELGEGFELDYWKEDESSPYISLLTVTMKNGRVVREIYKGDRTYYAKFNYFNR